MVDRIYPTELQLNRANSSDTEAPFLDLNLCIFNGTVSTKIYDKRDDFDFDIVNFPFLDGDVPQRTSYGVYISQLIRFASVKAYLNLILGNVSSYLMLCLWSGSPESYCFCFHLALAFQLFRAVESSSLFHLCNLLIFCVLGGVALMN